MAQQANTFGENLRTARQARGWSMDKLAAEAESSKGYISELERGERPAPPGRTAERFAKALGVDVSELYKSQPSKPVLKPLLVREPGSPVNLAELKAWIAEQNDKPRPLPTAMRLKAIGRRVPVMGEVAAGLWREAVARHIEDADEFLPIDVPGYERAVLTAMKVVGTSMDLVYPPGRYVVLAHPAEAGLRVGDYVVVERRRGDLVEVTLKEFVAEPDGRIALVPRSSDERYQQPYYLRGPGDDADQSGVQIIGVVVADYGKRERPPAVFEPVAS